MMRGLRRKLFRSVSVDKILSRVFSPHVYARSAAYSTERTVDIGQPTFKSHPQLLVEGEITPGIKTDEYLSRRKRLLELLPERSLAIIASAPVKMMTDVVPYQFRQDADYLYITGCLQPGGLAVLSEECGLCMFMFDPDPHDVIWQGQVAGVDAALDYFKAEKAFPMSVMPKILPEIIGKASRLFHNVKTALPSYMGLEAFQRAISNKKVDDISNHTHELRWIKSTSELQLMRQSASIACQNQMENSFLWSTDYWSHSLTLRTVFHGLPSLLQTMLFSRTSPEENLLAAKIEYECKTRGAQRLAFNPVVGGGANGSVIHYSRNDQKIRDGELVLMDVGCEFHGYLSDLTRTWPPCGSFSSAQELLYDLVLKTSNECMKLCKPGVSIQQIHHHSVKMLRRGLKEIGILKYECSRLYHQLNPTSIGHYLGMDVHDSAMVSNDRPLQPGVVITIEPGLYVPLSFDAPDGYRGIGIRIEDEVLITETGYEVLTGSMPKEIPHIKSLLNFGCCNGEAAPDLRTAFS